MFANPFHRLLAVATCFRGADQLIVAAVPIIAAAHFKLSEDQVGAMVAAQGSAWLLMSLPAGLLIDRMMPAHGLQRALALSFVGFLIVIAGYLIGHPVLFIVGAFITACAAVLGFLAEAASLQRLVDAPQLGTANARIQIVQSVMLMLAPALMGGLIARGYALSGFMIGLCLTGIGLGVALKFPPQTPPEPRERAPAAEIRQGLDFVRHQPLLRGIVVCALFWNMAFFALTAVYVPYALRRLAMDADGIGLAQSAMGLGSILAAFSASFVMRNFPPRFLLFFGPASSTLAAVILLFAPGLGGFVASITVYLLLGFGPILWFVCQNTIRQIVTPQGLLGRVGAVIQLAIYGVRSLGALLGGWMAASFGHDSALMLVILLFGLSTLTIPLSALGQLATMPDSAGLPASSPR